MSESLVKAYYSTQVRQEWRRLVRDAYHRLEFTTTWHFLERYLPARGLVLDAGGGPGRYTLELARRGYEVCLLDATQANLDFARRQLKRHGMLGQVRQIVNASIVDLSQFDEAAFDAVLCSGGPLSHLLDAHQRERAISELIRVTKPGAPIFVSVISRFGVMLEILIYGQQEIGQPHFELVRDMGDYLGGYGFTACHFFLPDELRLAFTRPDVHILEMAGLEGLSSEHPRELNRLAKDEQGFKVWLATHLQTCTHPAVVGMSEHMLIVCGKSPSKPG